MAFDIGGKLVLEDAFSATFDNLATRAGKAENAFEEVGQAADEAGTSRLEGLFDQLDALKMRSENVAAGLQELEVQVDTDQAELGLESVQERIAGLEDTIRKAQAMAKGGAVITPEGLQAYKQAQSELATLKNGLREMTGESDKAGISIMGLVKGITGLTIAGIGVRQIVNLTMKLTTLGATAIDVENAFEGLGRARGIDADRLIAGLDAAARGAVADSELMAAANQAILKGADDLANQLPGLFEAARASAMVTGKDATASFQSIVQGVLDANEELLRAQGLAVNLSSANQRWADANNRVVASLTDEERAQIAANEAIAAGITLTNDLGIAGETAREKMKNLPVAVDELKVALGELLVEVGVANGVGQLADDLSRIGKEIDARTTLHEIRESLKEIGNDDAVKALGREIMILSIQRGNLNLAISTGAMSDEEAAAATQALDQAMQDLIVTYGALIPVQNAAAASGAQAYDVWNLTHPVISASASATSSFQKALDALNVSLSGVATLEKQFAQAIVAGNAALNQMPEMPDITAAMDVSKLRDWGDAWLAVNPSLEEARGQLENTAVAIETHQQAVLADALAMRDMDQRLIFLKNALLGSSASADDFVAALSGMPPELLAALGPADELAAALARLKAQTDQAFVIKVTMAGYESVANNIENLAVRMARIYGPEKAREFYASAIEENDRYWRTIDVQDGLGAKIAEDAIINALGAVVSEAEASFARVEQAGKDAFDGIASSAGELRGKIENALKEGSEVTAEQMAATLAGKYEDVPLEAARRLDAIAARGFAELKAHPDWAALLKIPPEVLAGSEDQLKAWASSTSGAVRNLERPDLIDWDAFVANFKAGLDRDAAKDLTIDIAVGKLNEAGLLSGSKEEQRKQVAAALGLSAPELTIDALFKTSPSAKTDMINEITGGTGVVDFDAVMHVKKKIFDELVPPEEGTELVPPEEGTELTPEDKRWLAAGAEESAQTAPIDASKLIDVEGSAEELKTSGAAIAEKISSGITDGIDMSSAILMTAQSITLGATTFEKELKAAGFAVGTKIVSGAADAADAGGTVIINRLANAVAPEVAAILARNKRRWGGEEQ